jgi:hypothetical protein
MAEVQVTQAGPAEFEVEVAEGGTATTHRVTVPSGYREELGVPDVPMERLVDESFRFLLEREPKEQILRSFTLDVIARYFPEYPDEIGQRLR